MNSLKINLKNKNIQTEDNDLISLHSPEGYNIIKEIWEYTNWSNKYSYNFTWLGRPIIQLPDDMLRIQELIFNLRPDVIVETGIAHGGSLIFYASLLSLMGKGGVIGIDIDIRPHNKSAIENHELSNLITLIEGSSTSEVVLKKLEDLLQGKKTVLVILDSCHTKQHVLEELTLYSKFVSEGSYLIVADGIMKFLEGAPGSQEDWGWNNPLDAIDEFMAQRNDFINITLNPLFQESKIDSFPTYYPKGFLKKV